MTEHHSLLRGGPLDGQRLELPMGSLGVTMIPTGTPGEFHQYRETSDVSKAGVSVWEYAATGNLDELLD